jgi:hypothetical protein|tara:strand:- start:376 stop:486 length:111 start_codon:yes stop_codon:yes gene_type:complete
MKNKSPLIRPSPMSFTVSTEADIDFIEALAEEIQGK